MGTPAEEIKRKLAERAKERLSEAQLLASQEGIHPDPTVGGESKKVESDTGKESERPLPQESIEALSKIRIYRSRVHNSRFIFETGKEIFFTEGWYETSDSDEIRQLDAVANKVPTIYTDAHEKEIIAAILEARKQGFTGTIASMMTEQLTIDQRVAAMRVRTGSGTLNLPTNNSPVPSLLPPVDVVDPGVNTEATLRAAIARAKVNTAQSNG